MVIVHSPSTWVYPEDFQWKQVKPFIWVSATSTFVDTMLKRKGPFIPSSVWLLSCLEIWPGFVWFLCLDLLHRNILRLWLMNPTRKWQILHFPCGSWALPGSPGNFIDVLCTGQTETKFHFTSLRVCLRKSLNHPVSDLGYKFKPFFTAINFFSLQHSRCTLSGLICSILETMVYLMGASTVQISHFSATVFSFCWLS